MQDPGTDPLSPLARKIIAAGDYAQLVVTNESPAARELLGKATPDQLLIVPVKDYAAASAMLAALWLRHDALNTAHEIVQQSPEKLMAAAPLGHPNPGENIAKSAICGKRGKR
jgi:hypothetical protein